jgi:hypothetical protein
MSPDAVVARLRGSVDEERWTLFSLSGYRGHRPIIGKFGERTFRLQKRRYWHNDFAPFFYGQIQSEGNGTRIEGYFDIARHVRLYMRIWLGAVAIMGAPIFVLTLLEAAKGRHNVSGDAWVGLAVPPGLVAFGVLLPKVGRWMGRPQERAMLEHIQNTLGARLEMIQNP